MDFPGGSVGKESACNAGDTGLIPGSGRSPEGGHGNLLQYSCLENSVDRGCTSYVGRRRPLEQRKVPHPRHLLEWVLAAQAYLVSVVGSALQMETQLEVKGKNDKELYELEL